MLQQNCSIFCQADTIYRKQLCNYRLMTDTAFPGIIDQAHFIL